MSDAHDPAERRLIGRQREIEELRAGLRAVAGGSGRLFLLVGEAGIGKTRLADEIAREAAAQGLPAFWGRCWEGGGTPAFWPWSQILRAYLRERPARESPSRLGVAAVLVAPESAAAPANSGHLGEGDRFRVFQAVTDFLRVESTARPLALVFDDLHVADEDSLVLLRFVARELRSTPLLIVGTFREHEMGQSPQLGQRLAEIGRESVTIPLRGLDEVEAADLVRNVMQEAKPSADPSLSPQFIGDLHRITEGNPFFLHEITRSLLAEGGGSRPGGIAGSQPVLPVQVRAAIRQRIEPLAPPVQRLLSMAAVIGREFDGRLLERVAAATPQPEAVGPLLDAAVAAGVVRGAGAAARYSFTHALIRETLYEDLPPARRAELHHAAGLALEGLHVSDPDEHLAELAHHFFQAAPAGDAERAIASAERAASKARELCAYDEAVTQFSRAIEVLDAMPAAASTDARRAELLLAMGAALNDAGKRREAKATFARAVEVARRLGRAELFARAALGSGGDWQGMAEVTKADASPGAVLDDSLTRLLREALETLGERDSTLRARLLSRLAVELYFDAPLAERERLTREALEIAERLGDPLTRAHVLSETHVALWGPHNVPERLAMSREVVRLAQATGQLWLEAAGRAYCINNALELGDPLVVEAEAGAFTRLGETTRLPGLIWAAKIYDATRALFEGRLVAAEELAADAFDFGRKAQRPALMAYSLQMTALRREQKRLEEVAPTIGVVKAVAEQYPSLRHLRATVAFLYSELGDLAETRLQLAAALPRDTCDLSLDLSWLVAMTELTEACVFADDVERAALLYPALLPYARYNAVAAFCSACWGSVSRSLGLLATLLGKWEEAERHFELALERNRALGSRPWVAYTQLAHADMLGRRGGATPASQDRRRAVGMAREASATAQALGMKRLGERLDQIAAREGWRLDEAEAPRAGAPAPASGLEIASAAAAANIFRREGDYWTVVFAGRELRLKDTRGAVYLVHLLRNPGADCSALDLVSGPDVPGNGLNGTGSQGPTDLGDAGTILDASAKQAYKRRLDELRLELREAEEFNDPGRIGRLREEIDFLARELTRAVGLGGRDRRASAPGERARVRVTRAITGVLAKIAEHHPPLAQHLEVTVRTGTFCSYRPDPRTPIEWTT